MGVRTAEQLAHSLLPTTHVQPGSERRPESIFQIVPHTDFFTMLGGANQAAMWLHVCLTHIGVSDKLAYHYKLLRKGYSTGVHALRDYLSGRHQNHAILQYATDAKVTIYPDLVRKER